MKPIIAATDFSDISINAVNYAADMALAVKSELILLNVYNIPVVYSDGPVIITPVEELKEISEKRLEKLKNQVQSRVGGKLNVQLKTRLGNVAEELEDLCKRVDPFAVVIGTRGKTDFSKAIMGSAAYSIIRHLTCPVICVPPQSEFGAGIKKIGFACDFEKVSETTPAATIKQFIHTFKAGFEILNVDFKGKRCKQGAPEESFILHQMFLSENPGYHFIDDGDIENAMNEFAVTNKIDLLVVIPKKHNVIERIFRPSNTRHLAADTRVPLLCIHE